MRRVLTLAPLFALMASASLGEAAVSLNPIFTDHMVLQQQMPIRLWGTAAPGEQVTVALAGSQASTQAAADGRWQVELPAMEADGQPLSLTVTGADGQGITLADVLLGEVWLCSGQSNMEWQLGRAKDSTGKIPAPDLPNIRAFNVKQVWSHWPRVECSGSWTVCTGPAAHSFSAVGFFFARELQAQRQVPIGIINASWSGTTIQAWMRPEAFAGDPVIAPWGQNFLEARSKLPETLAAYWLQLEEWKSAVAEQITAQGLLPPYPKAPPVFGGGYPGPCLLHNAMIAPWTNFPIRGALWYQGESNLGQTREYGHFLTALIQDWRQQWGQPELPFMFVQLQVVSPGNIGWAVLRDSQTAALALPRVGMATSIDISDGDLHPQNKEEVGRRLALCARALAYDEQIPYQGPTYDHFAVEGNKIRLFFRNADQGLQCRGDKLKEFQIAGAPYAPSLVPAEAQIDGNTVLVWSDQVPNPVAVRYAWSAHPIGANLYNQEGLAAPPFRTDDWK